jgi:hypothetical protein
MLYPLALVPQKRDTAKGEATNMQIVDTIKVLKAADVSIKTLDGSVIEAKVNLGYENRVSDLFTKTDNSFIVLFDAVHLGSPKKKLLVLNKQHIVWAEPRDQE